MAHKLCLFGTGVRSPPELSFRLGLPAPWLSSTNYGIVCIKDSFER
jgi:hypothetical protein